jgi:hypothetical protein
VRPRYPVGYRPRVKGNSPGHSDSSVPYAGSTSMPDTVVKSAWRTRDRA